MITQPPDPHHAHVPYIVTVVAAIETAGVEVPVFDTEGSSDGSARNANLQLAKTSTLAAFGDGVTVFLGWNEEAGWWYGPDDDAPHPGWWDYVTFMNAGVLPAPEAVARWCLEIVSPAVEQIAPKHTSLLRGPHYRSRGDAHDGFAKQLQQYWRHPAYVSHLRRHHRS